MADPVKPVPRTFTALDYNECRDYLELKYNYRERDVLGKFHGNRDAEYRDFWHKVIADYDVRNGCFITFSRERLECLHGGWPDWAKEIYARYLSEFADDKGRVDLWVSW